MFYIKMAFWLIQNANTHHFYTSHGIVTLKYENGIAHHSLANKAISNDNKYYNNNIYMDASLSPSANLPLLHSNGKYLLKRKIR